MRGLAARDVLAEAVERFHPRLVMACSFQKEESVLLDLLLDVEPAARVFTIDTGVLFGETVDTWRAFISFLPRRAAHRGPSVQCAEPVAGSSGMPTLGPNTRSA